MRIHACGVMIIIRRASRDTTIFHYSFFIFHSSSSPHAQISQITSAPETAAISVKGMPMRMKSRVETL